MEQVTEDKILKRPTAVERAYRTVGLSNGWMQRTIDAVYAITLKQS